MTQTFPIPNDYDGVPAEVGATYAGRQGVFTLVGWCPESGLPLVDADCFNDRDRRVPTHWVTGSRRVDA